MKPRFLDFTQLALLLRVSGFAPDTLDMVTRKLATSLALQYPAFDRGKFITAVRTGKAPARTGARRTPLRLVA